MCANGFDRLISALECSTPDHLCLDDCTYCFYHRGIVAVSLAAHRWNDVVCFADFSIRITGICTPPVYALDQSQLGLPDRYGQTTVIRAKNNCGGNTEGKEERVSTAIIAHSDTSPLFHAPEHVFTLVSLFMQPDIVYCWMTAFGICRDTRADFAFCLRITELVGIVCLYQLATVRLQGARLQARAFHHHHCAVLRSGRCVPDVHCHRTQLGAWKAPPCCPSDTALPSFAVFAAVRCAYVRGVDDDVLRLGSLVCQDIEHALKHAKATPTHTTVIKGFVRAIRFGRIFPS